jgi:hypothetical protein
MEAGNNSDLSRYSFNTELSKLRGIVKERNINTSELDKIFIKGLAKTKHIDSYCQKNGKILSPDLYHLYKMIFEIWLFQHKAIINYKIKNGLGDSMIFVKHTQIFNLFLSLTNETNINEPKKSINYYWLIWRDTMQEIGIFFHDDIFTTSDKIKSKNLIFWFTSKSSETQYVFLAILALLLSLVFSILIIIIK